MSKRVETSLVSVIITSQLYVKVNVQVVNHGILGVGGGCILALGRYKTGSTPYSKFTFTRINLTFQFIFFSLYYFSRLF